MKKSILFLDTECTGLDEEDRLIQVAYKILGQNHCVNRYFKPPLPIKYEAMAVHHITNERVESSPAFIGSGDDVQIQTMLDQAVMVAHNAPFDIAMLQKEGIRVGEYIDTYKVLKFLLDEPSYKLQYFRYRFGIKFKDEVAAHEAEGDVMVLEQVFNWLTFTMTASGKATIDEVVEDMIRITKEPLLLRRIEFGKYRGQLFSEVPKDYLSWCLSKMEELNEDQRYTMNHYLKKDV